MTISDRETNNFSCSQSFHFFIIFSFFLFSEGSHQTV